MVLNQLPPFFFSFKNKREETSAQHTVSSQFQIRIPEALERCLFVGFPQRPLVFEKWKRGTAFQEQQLLCNSSSLDEFLKAEGMERVGRGVIFTPFVETEGQSRGWKVRAHPRRDPTHCQAITIITVLQLEMYSACFSKYEDLIK